MVLSRILSRGTKANEFKSVQLCLWHEATNGCNLDVATTPALGKPLSTHQQKKMGRNQLGYLWPISCYYPLRHDPDPLGGGSRGRSRPLCLPDRRTDTAGALPRDADERLPLLPAGADAFQRPTAKVAPLA